MLDPLVAYQDDPTGESVHHPYSAFNQGWDAAEAGHPEERNPYRVDTSWGRAWRDGWLCYQHDGVGCDDEEPEPWRSHAEH